jgi:hypothetical protein
MPQQGTDTSGKRLELLREAVGGLRRVAVPVNVGNPYIPLEMTEVALAASKLGLDLATVDIRRVEDIVPGLIAIRGWTTKPTTRWRWGCRYGRRWLAAGPWPGTV